MDMIYGLASAEEVAHLSGLEMLQAMMEGRLPSPTMARTLGFRLVSVADGEAVFEGEAGAHLLNPLGTVHGGFALTLVDSAAGCAVHSTLPPGVGYTTVETKVNFTRPIAPSGGVVRCEGRMMTRGGQIGTAEARLLDSEGRILAHGSSTLIILPPRG